VTKAHLETASRAPSPAATIDSSPYPDGVGDVKKQQGLRAAILSTFTSLSWPHTRRAGFSLVDQGLSVGGMFLVNITLARTLTKEGYGVFALSYSVFTFLLALHNGIILETYTVYGSGRYHRDFPAYAGLLWRTNILLGLGITAALALLWRILAWIVPAVGSTTFLGMTLMCGVLLTAAFVRRTFYLRGRPDLAAKFSAIFFSTCTVFLWLSFRTRMLNGFSAFLMVGLAWTLAGVFLVRELPETAKRGVFTKLEPAYWTEHWKYSRWVLLTAFVFQLTTQGYYWLAAEFLSVKDVGNLRSLMNIVIPLDQVFASMNLLILPVMCLRYTSEGRKGLLPVWKVYCSGWFLVTCGFAGLVNVWGKSVMHALYGGKFDDVTPLVGTLAFLPVVMGIGHTINGALKAAEKPNFVFYAYVISGVTTILLGIPLVLHLGLRGAVYGMLVSGAVYTAALAVGFWSITYMSNRPITQKVTSEEGSLSL
jgi:O-antigen/teichoic acid export membrane protein